jgi:Uma2 family endonuclease
MAIDTTPVPASAPHGKMTFEEFLDWMDEDTRAEWVNGEVIILSPASNEHQDDSDFLTALFRHFVEAYRLGVVLSAPFLMKISQDSPGREPDILFVATENLSRLKKTYLDGPADLVVEIISPESRARDRGEKFYEYEQGGVREYWMLDPIRRQPEFYQRNAEGVFQLVPPDEKGIYRSIAMPGLWIEVNWLWQKPLPTLMSVLKAWGLV